MRSLKELYRIGRGPSSSHTIGPERACILFRSEHPDATEFVVTLYGSLAKTGDGHGTGAIIESVLQNVRLVYDVESDCPHPNTMDLVAYKDGQELAKMRVFSVGGGAIKVEGREDTEGKEVYALEKLTEIRKYCEERNMRLYDYVYECEGEEDILHLNGDAQLGNLVYVHCGCTAAVVDT